MEYIDMHAHMVSRTTDDYEKMALSGCVAVTEPAFWAGYDRYSADVFRDYFNHITTFEPARAAEYGIQHYAWLCLNPKEAEDRELTKQVLAFIPEYLERPNVLGIGEIGLNRVTRKELESFKDHVELALEHNQMIHIHTPHLEDKYKGTKVIVETLAADGRIDPNRVMIDHAEEHTLPLIRDAGFLDRVHALPGDEDDAGPCGRHVRALWHRADRRCGRLRLGTERAGRGAEVHDGDAPARAHGRVDPGDRVREPEALPEPVAEVPAQARRRGRPDAGEPGSVNEPEATTPSSF